MLPKETLLEMLGRCVEEEDRAFTFYARYIDEPLFLADFPSGERARMIRTLTLLKQDAGSCAKTYRELLKIVGESVQDVF